MFTLRTVVTSPSIRVRSVSWTTISSASSASSSWTLRSSIWISAFASLMRVDSSCARWILVARVLVVNNMMHTRQIPDTHHVLLHVSYPSALFLLILLTHVTKTKQKCGEIKYRQYNERFRTGPVPPSSERFVSLTGCKPGSWPHLSYRLPWL